MTNNHVSVSCAICGSKEFEKPERPKDEDNITCSGCGAVSTWGEIRTLATKAAKKAIQDEIKRMVKK